MDTQSTHRHTRKTHTHSITMRCGDRFSYRGVDPADCDGRGHGGGAVLEHDGDVDRRQLPSQQQRASANRENMQSARWKRSESQRKQAASRSRKGSSACLPPQSGG